MVSRLNFEDSNLIKLGEKAQKTGGDLIATAAHVDNLGWSRQYLERLRPTTQSLEQTSNDLRKRFDEILKRRVRLDQQASDSIVRQVAEEMNRLRNRGRSVSNDGVNRELAHRQRSFAHAQERLSQAQSQLMRQAQDEQALLESRRRALNAAAQLNKLIHRDLPELAAQAAPGEKTSRNSLNQRGLDQARDDLIRLDRAIAASNTAQQAPLIRDVLRAVESQRSTDPAADEKAYLQQQQDRALAALAEAAREQGDLKTANEWEQLARSSQLDDIAEYAQNKLKESQQKPTQMAVKPWLEEMQEALAKGDLQRAEQAQAAAVQALSFDASRAALEKRQGLARSQMALPSPLNRWI